MSNRFIPLPLLVLLTTSAGSTLAQSRPDLAAPPRVTVDVSANSVSWTAFPGAGVPSPRQSGVSITPGLHFDGARHTVDLVGSWASDPNGGGIVQGSGLLSLYTPARGGVRGEFTGNASGSRLADGFTSARALGGLRVHAGGSRTGAWLGANAGTAGYDSSWRRVQQAEAGAWYAFTSGAVVLTTTPTRVALDGLVDQYTDVEAGVRLVRDRAEVGIALGTRTGRSTGIVDLGGSTAWGTVATTVWMTSTLALTVSAGTYPVDAAMRFPGGRFASAGMRVAFGRGAGATTTRASAPTEARTDNVGRSGDTGAPRENSARPELSIAKSTGSGTTRTLRIGVPTTATKMEVAGSFNNWTAVPMTRTAAGIFSVTLDLPAGQHEIAVRVNGGAWIAPQGLVVLRDEFGGESGVLVIDP